MGMIGNSLAQGLISGANIQDGTVDTPDIKDSAVTAAKIASAVVTPAKLSTGAPTWDVNSNVGVGVTLSSWGSTDSRALQLRNANSSLSGNIHSINDSLGLSQNSFYASGWKYYGNGASSLYWQESGAHKWGYAGSGTAGNSISFTQAMTLDNVALGSTYSSLCLSNTTGGGVVFQQSGTAKMSIFNAGNDGYIDRNNAAGNLYFRNTAAGRTDAVIDSTGNVTKPFNSCFLAARASAQTYSAGNAVVFDNEIFDQNSNYNPSTGIFTAPVTGKYLLSATILVQSATVGSNYDIKLTTSNRSYLGAPGRTQYQTTGVSWGDGYMAFQVTQICDMDVNDTAYVAFSAFGAGAIYGTSTGDWTRFSGCLIS